MANNANTLKNNKGLVGWIFAAGHAAQKVLRIVLKASPTGNAFEVLGSTGTTIYAIDSVGNVTSNAATPQALQVAHVQLTTAQLLAVHTTPIQLIAAPGTNKYIDVDHVVAKLTFNANAYVGVNALELRYTDGSGVKVTGDLVSAFLDAAATRVDKALGAAVAVAVANAKVVVTVPTADPTAGDSPIDFYVYYRVLSI